MNQLLVFHRLQQIDTRLDQVNAKLKQINILLEDNIALKKISKSKAAIKQTLDSNTKQLFELDQAVLTQLIKIQQVESNLYSGNVKNPKELQDLQTEIFSLKRHYLALENTQFQIMERIETNQIEYDKICLEFDSAEKDFFFKNSILVEERDFLLKEIDRLNAEKKAAENSIDPLELSFYNKLRVQKGGVAVSTIFEGACNSCGSTLTPAQAQAVKLPAQIICCPSCGRMLYAK